ncbi:MAG: OsmC family protein [Anaerolineales bacterium]
MSTVNVKWIESKLMLGADSRGQTMLLSSSSARDPEWKGAKPSDLLLLAAASCSMYDVVEILHKQREPLEDLEVICSGTQLPDPPYTFTEIHLRYVATGNLKPEKLQRAIELSQEKYCSVITTLRAGVKITSEFEVLAPSK